MIVLDENIADSQRRQLRAWRVRVLHVGHGIARSGTDDSDIPRLLLTLRRPTFFTQDRGFYLRSLCHERYCIVLLDVRDDRIATYARRILHHPKLNTQAKRMGKVIRAGVESIHLWSARATAEWHLPWNDRS